MGVIEGDGRDGDTNGYAAASTASDVEIYAPTPSDDTKARINRAMERNHYRDFSHIQKYEVTREASLLKKQQSFPMKLHEILACKEYNNIITWLPHGRAWKILNDDMLVEKVLGTFFNHKSRASFLRQVNNWGFKRALTGPDENAYYNEKFLRGLPHVSFLMKQSQAQKSKNKTSSDPTSASAKPSNNGNTKKASDHPIFARMLDVPPDFYAISGIHPLPEACSLNNSFTDNAVATSGAHLSAAAVVSAESSSDSSNFPGRESKKSTSKMDNTGESSIAIQEKQQASSLDLQGGEVGNNSKQALNHNVNQVSNAPLGSFSNSTSTNAGVASVIDASEIYLPSAGLLLRGNPMQQQFMGYPTSTSAQPQQAHQHHAPGSFNAFAQPLQLGQTQTSQTPTASVPTTTVQYPMDPTAMALLQRIFVNPNAFNIALSQFPFQSSLQASMQPPQPSIQLPLQNSPLTNFASWQSPNVSYGANNITEGSQPQQSQEPQQPQQPLQQEQQQGNDNPGTNPFSYPQQQL